MSMLNALFSLTLATTAPQDSCSSLIGTCDYYSCVESQRISCGPTGYPIGYGVKYCEILSALEFEPANTDLGARVFPADGNEWRDNVRSCLQEEMENHFNSGEEISCQSLRSFAFKSHPGCYTQSVSFCEMNAQSVVKVGLAIAPQDLLTSESQNQVRETAAICSQQISLRLKTERNFLVRLQLQKYKLIWNAVAANPFDLSNMLDNLGSDESQFGL